MILNIHLYHCIPISECPYQLKRINKKNKYVIPIILDNEKKNKKKNEKKNLIMISVSPILSKFKGTVMQII